MAKRTSGKQFTPDSLPDAIKSAYQRWGDWDRISRVRAWYGYSTQDVTIEVYLDDPESKGFDVWTKSGDLWQWRVGYVS